MLEALRCRSHGDAGIPGREMSGRVSALIVFALVSVAIGARREGVAASLMAQAPASPGDPLPGVTPREFEEFRIGLEDFREIEESSEGLGPLFNGTGCASCHSVPTIGGGSPMTELRMG